MILFGMMTMASLASAFDTSDVNEAGVVPDTMQEFRIMENGQIRSGLKGSASIISIGWNTIEIRSIISNAGLVKVRLYQCVHHSNMSFSVQTRVSRVPRDGKKSTRTANKNSDHERRGRKMPDCGSSLQERWQRNDPSVGLSWELNLPSNGSKRMADWSMLPVRCAWRLIPEPPNSMSTRIPPKWFNLNACNFNLIHIIIAAK